jgi:hypothetical protein
MDQLTPVPGLTWSRVTVPLRAVAVPEARTGAFELFGSSLCRGISARRSTGDESTSVPPNGVINFFSSRIYISDCLQQQDDRGPSPGNFQLCCEHEEAQPAPKNSGWRCKV